MSGTANVAPATKKQGKGPKNAAIRAGVVLKLRWDLHELPSSQHRAGLAGLALCVDFLKRKPDRKGVCKVEQIDERGLRRPSEIIDPLMEIAGPRRWLLGQDACRGRGSGEVRAAA